MDKYPEEIKKLIPQHFCTDNYSKSTTLDPQEWHDNIEKRAVIERFLKGCEDPLNDYSKKQIKAMIEDNMIFGFGSTHQTQDSITFNIHEALLRSISISELEVISDDVRTYFDNEEYQGNDVNDYSTFTRMGIAYASVNLNAPDELLIKSFVEWLKKIRSKYNSTQKKNRISDSVLRRWQANKVIEYIDLSQWYRIRNKKLHDYQAAAILFPNDLSRNTVDVITKTIRKKLVPEILSNDVLWSLMLQDHELRWKENF